MAIALVQVGQYGGAVLSNLPAKFSSPVTSGNLVVVNLFYNTSGVTGIVVTDDKGNTYTQAQNISSGYTAAAFYRLNCTNGPTLISENRSAFAITIEEYSGVTTFDGSSGNVQAAGLVGTDTVTSGAFTTTGNGDLIWGASWNGSGPPAAGTGFTTADSITYWRTEYKVQPSAGSTAATYTYSSSSGDTSYTMALGFAVASGGSTVDLAGSFVV